MAKRNKNEPAAKTETARMMVLLENPQGRFGALAEGLAVVQRQMATKEQVAKVEQGMGDLTAAVRQNSTDIKHLDTRVGHLETGVERMDARLGHVETRLGHVETRVERLDARVERMDKKLDLKANREDVVALAERVSAL